MRKLDVNECCLHGIYTLNYRVKVEDILIHVLTYDVDQGSVQQKTTRDRGSQLCRAASADLSGGKYYENVTVADRLNIDHREPGDVVLVLHIRLGVALIGPVENYLMSRGAYLLIRRKHPLTLVELSRDKCFHLT